LVPVLKNKMANLKFLKKILLFNILYNVQEYAKFLRNEIEQKFE
jgi:hypothetical protein